MNIQSVDMAEDAVCHINGCDDKIKNVSRGLCNKHYKKFLKYGDPLGGKTIRKKGLGSVHNGYIRDGTDRNYRHRKIVESVLGKPLPQGSVVHHIDENRDNNNKNNLVLCPSTKYHCFIHKRLRALKASGNKNWLKCNFCKQFDDPKNMYVDKKTENSHHRDCLNAYNRSKSKCNQIPT